MIKANEIDPTVESLLRLNEEPCVYYNESQIHQILMNHSNDFMNILKSFYGAWNKNEKIVFLPKKQVFTDIALKGDLRVMPCIINDFEGRLIKAVKIIGTNEEERIIKDKICVGKALLVNPTDNFVEAIFDVCALSSFRTAAISILAFKYLADPDKSKIGIIGAGRIGFYTAFILHHWLGIKKLMVADPNKNRIDNFKRALSPWFAEQIQESPLEKLCVSCDTLFTTTNSTLPILSADNAGEVNFISSVGADADNLSELDSSLIKNRQIVTDSRQGTHYGDLKRWLNAKLITEREVIELREIIGQARKRNTHKLFISTGIAVQDALICNFLLEHLRKQPNT